MKAIKKHNKDILKMDRNISSQGDLHKVKKIKYAN